MKPEYIWRLIVREAKPRALSASIYMKAESIIRLEIYLRTYTIWVIRYSHWLKTMFWDKDGCITDRPLNEHHTVWMISSILGLSSWPVFQWTTICNPFSWISCVVSEVHTKPVKYLGTRLCVDKGHFGEYDW